MLSGSLTLSHGHLSDYSKNSPDKKMNHNTKKQEMGGISSEMIELKTADNFTGTFLCEVGPLTF